MVYKTERASAYKSLVYLGTRRGEPIPEVVDSSLHPNLMAAYISQPYLDWFQSNKGDFCVSKSCVKTLDKSCMKLDNTPVVGYKDEGGFHRESLEFMSNMYSSVWCSPILNQNQILERLTLDSACGLVENIRGCKTKSDCVLAGLDTTEYEPNILPNEIPFWKVSGKVEIKKVADYIEKDKQRTFIIQPFKSLWNHMKLYSSQNDSLKMLGWSAYGFNPYEGGVERLARALLRPKLKRFWTLDVVGWDRIYPFLRDVYDIKSSLLPKELFDLARKVADDACESVLCFPNGDFVHKSWGNNSGSGSTTADNIFGMTTCVVHVFYYLGLSTRQIEESVVAFIFGDDVIGSDDFDFISDEQLRGAFHHVFGLYGFVLDPLVITHDLLDPSVTFLGFSFSKTESGFFVPKYPLDRLCSSFIFDDTKEGDPDKELGKMVSLMLMSAGHGRAVFDFFRSSLVECVLASDCDTAVRIRNMTYIDVAIPSFDDVLSWYSGHECLFGLTFDNFFDWIFFQDGGRNKDFLIMDKTIIKKNPVKEAKYKAASDESLRKQLADIRSQMSNMKLQSKVKVKPQPNKISLPAKVVPPKKNAVGKDLLVPVNSKLAGKAVNKTLNLGKRRNPRRTPNSKSWKAWNNAKPLKSKIPKKELKASKLTPSSEGHYGRESGGWWDTAKQIGKSIIDSHAKEFGPALDSITKISGLGDYEVDTNSVQAAATAGKFGNDIPMMVNSKCCNTIRHREYLGDVFSSSSGFSAIQFSINPGLFSTFPWLAPIANCFTSYRMRGLVYEFNSLATEYSAQTSLGFVALGTQYNTIDPPFTDKITMLNSEYANSRKPSETFLHAVECAANQLVLQQLYVRDQGPPNDTDIRFYDLGTLTLACGGQAANDELIGELWSSYEIEFFQPKNDFQFNTLFDSYKATNGFTNAHPLTGNVAGSMAYVGPNGLPEIVKHVLVGTSGDAIQFFGGVYGTFTVTFYWYSANAASFEPPIFTGSNGVTIFNDANSYVPFTAPSYGASTTMVVMAFVIQIADDLDPNSLPQLAVSGGGTLPVGSTPTVYFNISQLPSPDGPAISMRPLTKKAEKIWQGKRDKFQWMKMHDDLSSSSSDSSSDEESPLDLIVKATDGSISMEQQATLLKIYTDMLNKSPVPITDAPSSRVVKTSGSVNLLSGKVTNPVGLSDKSEKETFPCFYSDKEAYYVGLKESNDLLLKQVLRHREKINTLEKDKSPYRGVYDDDGRNCYTAIEVNETEPVACQITTTCPF